MWTNRTFLCNVFLLCVAVPAFGQKEEPEHPDIVEHITADSINIVIQDEEVAKLLEYSEPQKAENKKNDKIGYRVQVFSDNNARTARNEARSKQRSIGSRFPNYRTYVTYTAPYWRLKVGDFRTQEEANTAAAAIKRAFPGYTEIRVVRDRINLPKTQQ
ncbi:MAG: SPOR domain-containing protein [Muribaculaceae bacterium]|nr:SPOR domain-containing protein [Muribaculaceae bacterium]